jgi:4-oxalocrotonate tautomerase
MPHVIVKLYSGRSEQQKARLAEDGTKAIMTTLNYGEDSVSAGIEHVEPRDWAETVLKPGILAKSETSSPL